MFRNIVFLLILLVLLFFLPIETYAQEDFFVDTENSDRERQANQAVKR